VGERVSRAIAAFGSRMLVARPPMHATRCRGVTEDGSSAIARRRSGRPLDAKSPWPRAHRNERTRPAALRGDGDARQPGRFRRRCRAWVGRREPCVVAGGSTAHQRPAKSSATRERDQPPRSPGSCAA
jgi:hypothetical protein